MPCLVSARNTSRGHLPLAYFIKRPQSSLQSYIQRHGLGQYTDWLFCEILTDCTLFYKSVTSGLSSDKEYKVENQKIHPVN